MTKDKEEMTDGKTCQCKKANSSGWFGENKRHSEVATHTAMKEKLRNTARTPMKLAEEPEQESAETKKKPFFRLRPLFAKNKQEEPEEIEEPNPEEEEADPIPGAGTDDKPEDGGDNNHHL